MTANSNLGYVKHVILLCNGACCVINKFKKMGGLRKITANAIRVNNIDCEPNRERYVYTS